MAKEESEKMGGDAGMWGQALDPDGGPLLSPVAFHNGESGQLRQTLASAGGLIRGT